ITIEPGITLKGELTVFDKKAIIDFNVDQSGIRATGCLSKIDIGSFHITKSPSEVATMTPARASICKGLEEGPIIDMQLNKEKQSILISGMLELDNIFSVNNYLTISKDGIS